MRRRNFYEESYHMIGQTCPAVDLAFEDTADLLMREIDRAVADAMDTLRDRVKEQTGKLREALVEAIKQREDLRAELEDAERQIEYLKNEMSPGWAL